MGPFYTLNQTFINTLNKRKNLQPWRAALPCHLQANSDTVHIHPVIILQQWERGQLPAAIYLPNSCFNEGNTEAELSPCPIWIYWSNCVSQPPEIKINHHDGETIPTLIRGHRSINHSLPPLWPALTPSFLCSPHYSRCSRVLHTRQECIHSFGVHNYSS